MKFTKSGRPYKRRRKSWEIPASERRGKGYPRHTIRSSRMNKAEAAAVAALAIGLILACVWITIKLFEVAARYVSFLKSQYDRFPGCRKLFVRQQISFWAFTFFALGSNYFHFSIDESVPQPDISPAVIFSVFAVVAAFVSVRTTLQMNRMKALDQSASDQDLKKIA